MSADITYRTKCKIIRAHLGCSTEEFAVMMGISFSTVRNWEQTTRGLPTPSARALIDIIYADPHYAVQQLRRVRGLSEEESAHD